MNERSEIFILRHGDVITSKEFLGHLTCTRTSSEIQVTSSAADADVTANTTGVGGTVETPQEEETEDEDVDDIDNMMTAVKATQSKSQQAATPQLSNQRFVVVHETPTAARINAVENESAIPGMDFGDGGDPQPPETTPTPDPMVEPYSTARNGQSQSGGQKAHDGLQKGAERMLYEDGESELNSEEFADDEAMLSGHKSHQLHPKVLITRKRPSPAIDERESETGNPGRKRVRTTTATAQFTSEDETQDSRMSNIAVDTSLANRSTPRIKKRKSIARESIEVEIDGATPSRSQRSQRSATVPDAGLYEGDIPRVATSNSSIAANSQSVRFLKKQGGSLIESVKESFNVLWWVFSHSAQSLLSAHNR